MMGRRGIAVIELATCEEVSFVEVKPGRDLERVERGMLINMDRDKYATESVGDDVDPHPKYASFEVPIKE